MLAFILVTVDVAVAAAMPWVVALIEAVTIVEISIGGGTGTSPLVIQPMTPPLRPPPLTRGTGLVPELAPMLPPHVYPAGDGVGGIGAPPSLGVCSVGGRMPGPVVGGAVLRP